MERNKEQNIYQIAYFKKGKPTGKRKFIFHGNSTFEEILFDCVLNPICNSVYKMDYWYAMLGTNLIITRKSIGGLICIYSIVMKAWKESKPILCEYEVEINCLFDTKEIDLFEEYRNEPGEIPYPKIVEKSKTLAKWVRAETHGIKHFLIELDRIKELKLLKQKMSKATFYRNLKTCLERGYVKDEKLVRRVWVPDSKK